MSLQPLSFSAYQFKVTYEQQRHERTLKRLEKQLKLFQTTCQHGYTRFQADPAGGNDSYTECLVCNKVL